MKPLKHNGSVLMAACLCVSAAAYAQQDETNRLTLSARFGFNISARFKGLSTLPPPSSTRQTPGGANYNYDDGYVFTDTSRSVNDTWYWGYDDSSRQVSGNNIILSRSTLTENASSATAKDDPSYGAELLYSRLLSTKDRLRLGFELAANYLNLSLSDSRTLSAGVTRTSYPFPFTPGTTPPTATPAEPYQGSFEGPGFVLGAMPGEPTVTTVSGGASIEGSRKFDANIWGFRFGPYLEFPVNKYFKLSLSGGLAGALVDGDASWSESVIIEGVRGETLSGDGHDTTMRCGFYVGASVSWQFSQRWGVLAGVQYQDLGRFNHSFGGRQVELDLSESLFATLGVSFNF